MAQASSSVTIDSSPDAVWAVVGDVGKISNWLPALSESWIEGDSNTRICVLPDGGRIVETIESSDDQARSYTYTIADSPLPLSSYRSTVTVTPAGSGSQVEWSTEFEPAGISTEELQGMLQGIYAEGLANLKAQFG